jgi:type VI secretion system secreted protein VgrG
MSSTTGFVFTSPALDAAETRVVEIHGREQIGQLYEFRVQFESLSGPLAEAAIDELLHASCSFTLGTREDETFHGIVRDVELIESADHAGPTASYVAVVVPKVWLLTTSKVSRVFQNMSVPEMARTILTGYGLGPLDFELRVAGSTKREFCVQYEESDLDFLQRWFEHEGLYYWFEQSEGGEVFVVGDRNAVSKPIVGEAQLPYRDLAGLVRTEDSIFRWNAKKQRIPARVVLKDYNYMNPSLPMVGRADVAGGKGFGVLFAYGEHFDNADMGKALATRRAERCRADQVRVRGVSDCARLRAGHSFEMWNHHAAEHNRRYLLTSIEHRVGMIDPSDDGRPENDEPRFGYRASFEAIPLDVQFRPASSTPWPSIHGVMHAHVDSDASGQSSTLDTHGRYRVRLPFDGTGNKGERASCWVRMAQSYAGTGYGSHFPLHKGAEVVLAFLDGDPDRPIIVGAVPNAHTPGPSARPNATQSVMHSASGVRVVMEDMSPPSSRGPN